LGKIKKETEDKFTTLLQESTSLMATKQYTKGQLARVEKQMEKLFHALNNLNQGIKDTDEDEAMVAKKGFQCMSCDKRILNFYGNHADYQVNKKFPL
jgi:hypothetical protein